MAISFTQGDTAILNLSATDGQGNPFNLTGASFSTQIKGSNGIYTVFGNSQHAIVSAANGTFTLTLSAIDTGNCGLGPNKEILTLISQTGSTIYFRGVNILTVNPPIPIQ